MKRFSILLVLAIGFWAPAVAQKPKRPVPPPPVIRDIVRPVPKQTVYEKLLDTRDYANHAFAYTVDADTVILPDEVFRKQLEISSNGVRLEISSAKDTLRFTKGAEPPLFSHYVKYSFFDLKMTKDIAVLTNSETGEVRKYRLFLNPKKTKVTRMQDLATQEIYLPAEFKGVTPTIGF